MSFRPWVAVGIVIAAVLSALANFVPWPVAALLGLGAGVLTLVGTLWLQHLTREVDLTELAGRVQEQWTRELQSRGISLSAPLAVRWTTTDRTVSAPAANIVRRAVGGKPVGVRASGELHDLAAKFQMLPRRQLVILGAPGAGKTVSAVFLALDLLAGEPPVPVVLQLSSWNPNQHLYDWAADQLSRTYPKVASAKAWHALLSSGKLLLVLDGLDELPEPHRTHALGEINTATDGGNPFVLTCRADEYEALVQNSGIALTSALVVELSPVTPEQVVAYLQRPGQETRWAPVFAALRASGPLAEVLSLPFMAALARFSFARPDTVPAELCALNDAHKIRIQLLAAFLPAAYSPRPHPDLGTTNKSPYTTAQATRWLSFLARHMAQFNTVELAWWRLYEILSGWRRIALRLFLPAVPLTALAGNAVGLFLDRETDLDLLLTLFGLFAGLAIPIHPRRPGWIDPTADEKAQKHMVAVSGLVFLVLGVWGGISLWQTFPGMKGYYHPFSPLAGAPIVVAILMVWVIAVVSGVLGWVVYTVQVRTKLASRALPTVDASLAADRRFVEVNGLGYFCLGVTGLILYHTTLVGQFNLVSTLVCLAATISMFTWHASPSLGATTWLLRRRLPPQLLPFLKDAYSRGVLRQAGAVYEFRHALLQKYLADIECWSKNERRPLAATPPVTDSLN